jgi:hypothetical protein
MNLKPMIVRAISMIVVALCLATATSCGSEDQPKAFCDLTVAAIGAIVKVTDHGDIPPGLSQVLSAACQEEIKQQAAKRISQP